MKRSLNDEVSPSIAGLVELNPAPLTPQQRLTARDGHFFDASGRRVRFIGLDLSRAPLPTKAEATALAPRLHALGINLVRLTFQRPENQDTLDFLIAELKKSGVYVAVDLHGSVSCSSYFETKMIALQKELTTALMTHRNPYTGLRLSDDPVLALLTLNGNQSLVGSASQLDSLPPPLRKPLERSWNAYLQKKYVTTKALQARWGGPASVPPKQSLEAGTIELAHISGIPAGIDFTHFLMTVEDTYCRTLKSAIRALGCTAPLTCAQASAGGIAGVWREAKLDWVELQATPETSSLDLLAMHRVGRKPFIVSASSPELAPLLFAYAAWQDWDGLFISEDPALLPAGAALFLRGDLSPARNTITLTIPTNKIPTLKGLGSDIAFWGIAETRFVQGELSLAPEKAEAGTFLTHRAEVRFELDPGPIAFGVQAFPIGHSGFVWDRGKEQFKIDSPASKALMGKLGGSSTRVTGFVAEVAPSAATRVALLLTSSDNKPTEEASWLLLTTSKPVPTATVHIATKATSATVWALDSTGKRQNEVRSVLENGTLTLELTAAHQATRYELALLR